MKRIIFLLASIIIGNQIFAQSTYYWVGGASGAWSTPSNWNTVLGGGGSGRSTPNTGDILIFDGSNIGAGASGTVSVSNIQAETIAALRLQNAATVTFTTAAPGPSLAANMSRAAGVALTGNTTVTSNVITMSNTTGVLPGSIITAGSGISTNISVVTSVNTNTSVNISQPAISTGTGTSFTFSQPNVFSAAPAVSLSVGDFVYTGTNANLEQITSVVNPTTYFTATANPSNAITSAAASKVNPLILAATTDALFIQAGSTLNLTISSAAPLVIRLGNGAKGVIDGTLSSAGNNNSRIIVDNGGTASLTFRNGSVLNAGTAPSFFGSVANPTNNNVIFESGSQVIYSASVGANGLWGAMYPAAVVQMKKGSTYVWNGSATGFSAGTNRSLPNVKINVTLTQFSPPNLVDTLLIPSGVSVTTTSGSYLAFTGDLINEGSLIFSGATGPNLVMCGNVPQRVVLGNVTYSSTGSFQRLVVSPQSTFIVQPSSAELRLYAAATIFGTINFGNNVIKSTLASGQAFLARASNTTVGSSTVTVATANSYSFSVANVSGFAQGMYITGNGIPANTIITNVSSSSNVINTSNPVTVAEGATVSCAVNPNGATIITSNTGGLGASFLVSGTSTFALPTAPGVNYIFQSATTTPFPASLSTIHANNLTLGGNLTSNVRNLYVNGTLNMASNMLSVQAGDTLRVTSGTAIAGSSPTAYISLGVNNTDGSRGCLRMSNLSAATLFPVGANGYYLPATITPAASGEEYSVSVFNGLTQDGTPNGTAVQAALKADAVDAVWNIASNTTPTGNVGVQLGWPASLEGAAFSSLGNSQIGLALNDGTGWGVFSGSGNNTTNTASQNFNAFGSFSVGKNGQTLPVRFIGVNAAALVNSIKVSWQVGAEINVDKYVVEAAVNTPVEFKEKAVVLASGAKEYSFTDVNPASGDNFYRIKAIDKSGAVIYSNIVKQSLNKKAFDFKVYPNPLRDNNLVVNISSYAVSKYQVRVIDYLGRICSSEVISHNGGSGAYTIQLNKNIPTGNYIVQLLEQNEVIAAKSLLIAR